MAEVIVAAVVPAVESLVKLGNRHFGYIIHYKRSIVRLEDRVRELESMITDTMTGKQRMIEIRNAEVISAEMPWLEKAGHVSGEVGVFIAETRIEASSSRWDVISRHRLGKKASMLTFEVEQILSQGNRLRVINLGEPSIPKIPSRTIVNLESRTRLVKEALDALASDRVVCIHGEAGVGKTELVNEIVGKKKFKAVARVEISPEPDFIWRAQGDIGDALDFQLKGGTVPERAEELRRRVGDSKKERHGPILIVLDNVKDTTVDLAATIGLEVTGGCKLIIVLRNLEERHVYEEETILKVERLSPEEADRLFWAYTEAINVDDLEKQVVNSQFSAEIRGGLPISLVLAAAQSQGLLDQFRKARESYAKLPTDEDKKLFLLCCAFDPDSDIPMETLFRIGLSFRIFNHKEFTHELRQEAHEMVGRLKSLFLLEAGEKDSVKMSVGRNLAMIIGSESDGNRDLLSALERYQNLSRSLQELDKPKFLDLSMIKPHDSILHESTTKSIQQHTSLRFLSLRGLTVGETNLSFITQLTQLEILSFAHCHIIEALDFPLPYTLKMLDLTECKRLARISPGVLSGLPQLEELYTLGCPVKWEIPGGGGPQTANASLGELTNSPRLTSLTIRVPSGEHLPGDLLVAAKNLTRFQIYIGDFSCAWDVRVHGFTNRVCVCVPEACAETHHANHGAEASSSEILPAESEPVFDLIRLFQGRQSRDQISIFKNLISLELLGCEGMKHIFSAATVTSFVKLQTLKIMDCETVEEVIGAVESGTRVGFPELRVLVLKNLPRLQRFCDSGENCVFDWPLLDTVRVKELPNMTTFASGSHSAPRLRAVHVTFLDACWMDNLNATFQYIHSAQRSNGGIGA